MQAQGRLVPQMRGTGTVVPGRAVSLQGSCAVQHSNLCFDAPCSSDCVHTGIGGSGASFSSWAPSRLSRARAGGALWKASCTVDTCHPPFIPWLQGDLLQDEKK